ncbi:MAG: M14 family zinc carboxypeptidase [Bacteroidota bacterium]
MKMLLSLFLSLCAVNLFAQSTDLQTVFERSGGQQTATYEQGIAFYERLAASSKHINMLEMGLTDSGHPLHLVVFSENGKTDFDQLHQEGKTIFLINNAIHPGEADGVEASMMLLRDLAQSRKGRALTKKVAIAVIPFYNIGGVLNRNSTTRFNQNGPEVYGFRGNARNFDLNRDFIKADTRNSWSFHQIFQRVDPDLFLDTHVTNGSDHQFHLTLLSTLPQQLGEPLGSFLKETINPVIYEDMEDKDMAITPYVNVHGRTPDRGWSHFYDSPRYSSGYASLFQTVGFMSEAHALKSFQDRVPYTYELMKSMLLVAEEHGKELQSHRAEARKNLLSQERYVLQWQPDRDAPADSFAFRGYEAETITGSLTGAETYRYNHERPYTKNVPILNTFKAVTEANAPTGYFIPRAWWPVVNRLLNNGVHVDTIQENETRTVIVGRYEIVDYGTSESPYEGHYPHYNVQVNLNRYEYALQPGDFYVPLNQARNAFIVHVLEPQSRDSYFNWNLFDTILQQKEGPSNYMLEVRVEELKASVPDWESRWEDAKAMDENLAENPNMLMYWLYQNSPFKEVAHLHYPIYRAVAE